MLKRSVAAGLVLIGLSVPLASGFGQVAPPGQPSVAGQPTVLSSVSQDFRFITWEGSRGSNIFAPERGKGSQIYAPLLLGTIVDFAGGAKWELAARTGYVWSNHATKGQEATYEGMTDTQLSAQVTLSGFTYVSPVLGLVVNLPTGESFLPGKQRFARMDPDLVELGAYGEGLNINPTIGFTFAPTSQFTLTPAVGYAWRGAFDREDGFSLTPMQSIDLTGTRVETDPGNALTASLTSVAKIGTWTIQGSLGYTSQSAVTQDGVPVGQAGAGYIANVAAQYPITPTFGILLNGSWGFSERNKVPLNPGGGQLIEEAKNSNSHVLIGAIQPTFVLTDKMQFALNYSILYRNENYYDIIEDRFIPARTKHSAGLLFDYALSKNAAITLSASRFWVNEEAGGPSVTSPGPPPIVELLPERSYTGWAGSLSAKIQFWRDEIKIGRSACTETARSSRRC